MTQDELKDGAIVNIDGDKYTTKKQKDPACAGCSFYDRDYEYDGCYKPPNTHCWKDDDYYIYIKLEKQ